jgi:poly(3-hydroxybutyrate) depolymerase
MSRDLDAFTSYRSSLTVDPDIGMSRSIAIPVAALLALAAGGCGDAGGAGGAGAGGGSSAVSAPDATGPGPGSTGSLSTGSTGAGGAPPSCDFTETPGTSTETIDVSGVVRSYVLSIPASADGKTPVALVLGFHGFNGTAEGASQYFGLTGDEAAYYVYPQALPLPGQGGGVGWDMDPDGVDVAFFDALVTALSASHCIDPDKIFAAGHSHGASFSNHLGCYRPDVVRAIAPVAGGGPWAGPCTGSVSAMLVHGLADTDVPIDAGMDSRDHWLEANGCAGAPSSPTNPAPCAAYDGCAEPVLWCEHTGGHEWPGFAGAGIRGFFLSFP